MVFFILSQILAFLITPITWIIALILLAIFLRNKKWAHRCLIFVAFVSVFFSNRFIADEAVRLWEYPITRDAELTTYDVGIVLGGGMVTVNAQSGRMTFRNNTDRLFQAISLYKTGVIRKMLLSSGSGSLTYRDMLESSLIQKYLVKIGIPDSVILVDSVSDNTYQNVVNSLKILKKEFPSGNGKYLLITSSSHMRRALACFHKAGIIATPYAALPQAGTRNYSFGNLFIPSIEALKTWDNLLHEWVGYLTYAVFGYL